MKKQRSVLRRDDLLILINGFMDFEVEFEWCSDSSDMDLNNKENFEAIQNNLDKMISCFWYPIVIDDYNLIHEYYTTRGEKIKFLAKFKLIDEIQAADIINPTEFLEFLDDCGAFANLTTFVSLINCAPVLCDRQLVKFQSIVHLNITKHKKF